MSEVVKVPMSNIRPGQNDRTVFKSADITELAESIRQDGLIQPITVRPIAATGTYEIVAGECRFRACQSLGLIDIDCMIKPMSDEQTSRVMLAENVHRADIDPIDEANAYQRRMAQFSLTVAQVADWAKVSESKVRGRLALLKVVPEVQHLIRSGNMPLGYAACLDGLDNNFQRIAMRYFGTARRPSIAEFKAVCNGLLEKQNQLTMFDLDAFMVKPVEQIAREFVQPVHTRTFRLFGLKITVEYPAFRLFGKAVTA
jgi:ParB family chromosome partitioning protein